MPGGDGTGPQGMGPMTGRAMGWCAGYPAAGFGWGRGRGGGWGRRNVFHATGLTGWQRAGMGYPAWGAGPAWGATAPFAPAYGPDQELNALKAQAEYLEDSLEGIRQRMTELEQGQSKDVKG